MKKTFSILIFLLLFLAAPLLGVIIRGDAPWPYLQFPPTTLRIEQPDFSWVAFFLMLIFIIATTWPFWRRMATGSWKLETKTFPGWGWPALAGLILFWILAWTRFPWFEPLQRHTFFPVWFFFILVLNAVAVWLSGNSPLAGRPRYFALLFPASALFWWLFEFLNRFVNNWYYSSVTELGGLQYFLEATLAFSTVLPAFASMHYLVMQIPVFKSDFKNFPNLPWLTSRRFLMMTIPAGILGLILLGLLPDHTFPLVWIAPGFLWIGFEYLQGKISPLVEDAARGDWTIIWSSAIAALICGFFWELWNIHSQAKWIYNVPLVEHFYLFEMPLLGYAGYLPFGVICAMVSQYVFKQTGTGTH